MRIFFVLAPSAPSHAKENGACPPVSRQGWKWSLTTALSKPSCSARIPYFSRSCGPNCSADAFQPSVNIGPMVRAKRDVPRPFDMPWGRGEIVEEATTSGEYHE